MDTDNRPTMTDLGEVLTEGTELSPTAPGKPEDARLHIRFNHETQTVYRANGKHRVLLPGAIVLHYVEKPAKTPTGGRYVKRAMTIRTKDGRKWVGTMRKDTDIVILRPAPEE